jgi:hypothetical protein
MRFVAGHVNRENNYEALEMVYAIVACAYTYTGNIQNLVYLI